MNYPVPGTHCVRGDESESKARGVSAFHLLSFPSCSDGEVEGR